MSFESSRHGRFLAKKSKFFHMHFNFELHYICYIRTTFGVCQLQNFDVLVFSMKMMLEERSVVYFICESLTYMADALYTCYRLNFRTERFLRS